MLRRAALLRLLCSGAQLAVELERVLVLRRLSVSELRASRGPPVRHRCSATHHRLPTSRPKLVAQGKQLRADSLAMPQSLQGASLATLLLRPVKQEVLCSAMPRPQRPPVLLRRARLARRRRSLDRQHKSLAVSSET